MKEPFIKKRKNCRVCQGKNLEMVFSLGPTPLANAFLKSLQIDEPESFYPLDVYFCKDCGFLQLGHVVSPQVLFGDYVYVSSTSPVFVAHFEEFSQETISRFGLNPQSLIVDIGSNDGILLRPFKKRGIRVLGIDPAIEIARLATKGGITTLPKFFSLKLVSQIVAKYGRAKVVTGTNVFAHIDDLDEVVSGVKKLLTTDGVFIIEVPYLFEFLRQNLFDTVYHEHLSYFTLKTLGILFERLGMKIFDVKKVETHGGSLRVFSQMVNGPHRVGESVKKFLLKENKAKLSSLRTYQEFAQKIYRNKAQLVKILTNLKIKGKKIAGYGAPAKGNTLLNFFGVGKETLDFIVDDSPWKQGLYTPGKHIPVVPAAELYKKRPDYVLILAWNFAQPIMKNQAKFAQKGGRFIIPVPRAKIV